MRVELLYFDGCPTWTVADERLTEALAILGRHEVIVHRRKVETPEEAEELRFIGSPTIRIDGTDPFATGQEQVGIACRVCATSAGLSGCPGVAQLVEVMS